MLSFVDTADDWTHHDYLVRVALLLVISTLAYGIALLAYRVFRRR